MKRDTYALDFGRLSDFKMEVTPANCRLALGMAITVAVALQIYDRLEQYKAELQSSSNTHNMAR